MLRRKSCRLAQLRCGGQLPVLLLLLLLLLLIIIMMMMMMITLLLLLLLILMMIIILLLLLLGPCEYESVPCALTKRQGVQARQLNLHTTMQNQHKLHGVPWNRAPRSREVVAPTWANGPRQTDFLP